MMKALVWCLFTIFVVNPSCSAHAPMRCHVDTDCSKEFYCSSDMYCNPCISCETTYKRQPLVSATCARVDEDCGNCLPGYQAEEWHGQRHSMKCYEFSAKPISSEKPSSNTDFSVNPSRSAHAPMPCQVDTDCSKDFYCFSDMYCNPCIDCETTHKRQPPVSATCVRVDEDCGNCLPGYQAEEWHGQRHSMKCYEFSAKPISSEKPSSNTDFSTISTIFEDTKRLCLRLNTTNTGIELENRNPSAPDLQHDQARSQDGINETDPLINSTQIHNEFIVQVEKDHLNSAIPIGPHHRDDDTLSEASQHTVPLSENINHGDNEEANDGPRETPTATSELSHPMSNASQTQQLPVDDEHVTPIENPSPSDVVVAMPAEASDSQDPNEEGSRGRRKETGESLEIRLALGVNINRVKECWA
ncbi:uncharacterized protein LOC116915651 isoform X2 [Daphnia magna]|uniref:uncharacterized protein LOC116915651 isoform X2 n=1 Tax=Daphnia magna TaxID=35525 RepID=UPI001E1BC35A|nr:uncharacterized protein LOC116915651 isoform X2 [Daphnia magna]